MLPLIDMKHLEKVNESWWTHFKWAYGSILVFVVLIVLALVHGLFPFLLASWPDRLLNWYLIKFQERRVRTGQNVATKD
jgi:hypothetical protein